MNLDGTGGKFMHKSEGVYPARMAHISGELVFSFTHSIPRGFHPEHFALQSPPLK